MHYVRVSSCLRALSSTCRRILTPFIIRQKHLGGKGSKKLIKLYRLSLGEELFLFRVLPSLELRPSYSSMH